MTRRHPLREFMDPWRTPSRDPGPTREDWLVRGVALVAIALGLALTLGA